MRASTEGRGRGWERVSVVLFATVRLVLNDAVGLKGTFARESQSETQSYSSRETATGLMCGPL